MNDHPVDKLLSTLKDAGVSDEQINQDIVAELRAVCDAPVDEFPAIYTPEIEEKI